MFFIDANAQQPNMASLFRYGWIERGEKRHVVALQHGPENRALVSCGAEIGQRFLQRPRAGGLDTIS